jgi:2-polyprenyl-6-methoxyphenol hydroxylase-like FAD-dependent oxidoreductase
MNQKSTTRSNQRHAAAFGHAVVIGGGIAGLTMARVLTDHFAQVTLIERDRLPDDPQFRRGAPQARHAHTLAVRGQTILEQQFPGLTDELAANGAVVINGGSEVAFFVGGEWHEVRRHQAIVSITCSRPLLEEAMYRRLADYPGLHILQEQTVLGLEVDKQGRRVTGVCLRGRRGLAEHETKLAADLVVDASGRESQAPQWLAHLGYTPPQETSVKAFAGYASRLYQRPAEFGHNWKTLYIRPTPPHGTRGGVIIPIEGDRWHVTLLSMAGDYPPTDEAGFLAFARSLPTPQFYEAIKAAEPLTMIYGYRRTESRVRHYDQLPRYLEGLLVGGDAAYSLNPVYAQGMTAAVLGSRALEQCLTAHHRREDLTGLAKAFQTQLSRVVADPWQMVTREDQRWPATEIVGQRELVARPSQQKPLKPAKRPAIRPVMVR